MNEKPEEPDDFPFDDQPERQGIWFADGSWHVNIYLSGWQVIVLALLLALVAISSMMLSK